MNSIKKILISFCLSLVILSNFCYAISYSYCMMTKKPKCACEAEGKMSEADSHGKSSCCRTETREISNSSSLYKLSDIQDNFMPQTIFTVSDIIEIRAYLKDLSSFSSLFEEISPTADIPIKNSVLTI